MITALKTCFKCGEEKPRTDFYRHVKMADGLLGKCKECAKRDVSLRASEKKDVIQQYDRNRPNRLERNKANRLRYAQRNEEQRRKAEESKEAWSDRNYGKRQAQYSLSNAVRDGKLVRPTACSRCRAVGRIHGHHWSYLEEHWLDVLWLCPQCHGREHARINECIRNGEEPYP